LRSWRSSSQLRRRALVSADVVVLISARRFALLLSRRRYTRWAGKLALPGGDALQSSDPIVALAIFVHLLTITSVWCLGPSVESMPIDNAGALLLGEFRAGSSQPPCRGRWFGLSTRPRERRRSQRRPAMQPDYSSRAERPMASRTSMIRTLNDDLSTDQDRWLKRAAFFHSEDLLYLRFVIPEGLRVLELGCGTGHLLAALKPSFGLGVPTRANLSAGRVSSIRWKTKRCVL
jgi:hypothetical protein